ncbi:hypothetical protein BJV82DRAFT_613163 [Fennellomyces sp. T-0311]|nr:hypothetical protein BJV82DRAFT_613163 [Fennellomyces sp. T-0311]
MEVVFGLAEVVAQRAPRKLEVHGEPDMEDVPASKAVLPLRQSGKSTRTFLTGCSNSSFFCSFV